VHLSAFPDPHPQQYYSSLATGPTALSPWHISGAGVQDTPILHISDYSRGDYEFGDGGGFTDDQIWTIDLTRPGRLPLVSAVEKRRYDSHTDFDVISESRVKKILFEKPTRLPIRLTGTTFNSVTPAQLSPHPTVNHPTCHHNSQWQKLYRPLTQIRPSNTILTRGRGSKLRNPADFSESQRWKR
jgi:hypothetical protein